MYEDEYIEIREVIRKSANDALGFLGKAWNVKITHPYSEFHIDFYDEGWRHQCNIHFDLPPNPDGEWYTQEIIRQLQEKCLGGNGQ